MKVGVVGSRTLNIDLKDYIPKEASLIISGGAKGIDTNAREYAIKNGIELLEILPEYKKYGRFAPLIRNDEIIKKADIIIAIWDGKSKGTKYVIEKCRKVGKEIKVIVI